MREVSSKTSKKCTIDCPFHIITLRIVLIKLLKMTSDILYGAVKDATVAIY